MAHWTFTSMDRSSTPINGKDKHYVWMLHTGYSQTWALVPPLWCQRQTVSYHDECCNLDIHKHTLQFHPQMSKTKSIRYYTALHSRYSQAYKSQLQSQNHQCKLLMLLLSWTSLLMLRMSWSDNTKPQSLWKVGQDCNSTVKLRFNSIAMMNKIMCYI